jgi:predicted ATPase
MIEQIHINNLKIHKDTLIETGALTILTGLNGMGKSTVLQSVLLLRQSFLSSDLDQGLNLNGDLCKVGTSNELNCWYTDGSALCITLTFEGKNHYRFEFDYPSSPYETFLPRSKSKNPTVREQLKHYGLFNDNFQYLSAYRFGPMDFYGRDSLVVQTKKQLSKDQGKGEYTIHFLDLFKDKNIPVPQLAYPGSKSLPDTDLTLITQTELWLQEISPHIRIKIEPVGSDFRLSYRYGRPEALQKSAANAVNTGFGVSYVLPLFVAILSAAPGAVILIENPESHIHPGGQAVFMKLASLAAKHGIQVVLETHSDHIINGALIAVKDGMLTPQQLSVYFLGRDDERHTALAHKLDITPTGKIHRPPAGFFDQFDKDLQHLTGF